MSDITALTFYAGRKTTGRRTSPVDQLTCRGTACHDYEPDVVQCVAVGSSDGLPEWKCEAELPARLKLGRVQVSCEGYDHPDDPYVLKGSCALTYDLVNVAPSYYDSDSYPALAPSKPASWETVAVWIVVGFIAWRIIKAFFLTPSAPSTRGVRRIGGPGPGFGGGPAGGSGGTGPPPPPYTKYNSTSSSQQQNQQQQWQPGFWSGALAGAAGLAGLNALRGNNSNHGRQYGADEDNDLRRQRGFFYTGDRRRYIFGAPARETFIEQPAQDRGWFGGGGQPAQNRAWFGGGPSTTTMRRPSSEASSSSSTLRTSTGFGGTRNR